MDWFLNDCDLHHERRRLEDILKTSCKTSSRRLRRQKIVTLKTPSRRLEDMS